MGRTQLQNLNACGRNVLQTFQRLIVVAMLGALSGATAAARGDDLAIDLPHLMQRSELDYYCSDLLKLAEPQRVFVDRLYETYVESCRKVETECMPDLEVLAVASGDAFSNDGYVPTTVDLYRQFVDRVESVADRLRLAEQRMLDQVPSILAEPQLEAWPRMLATRERTRMRQWPFSLPGAAIDLSRMVRVWDLPPETRQELDVILPEYETRLTVLWRKLDRELESHQTPKIEAFSKSLFDELGLPNDMTTAEGRTRSSQAHQEFLDALKDGARLQMDIERLNRLWITRICALIPQDRRDDFEMQFLQLGYGIVYRDNADPRRLAAKILNDKRLAGDARIAIDSLRRDFDAAYRRVSAQMEREYVAWCDQLARTTAPNGFDFYSSRMRGLREQRWRLTEQLLTNTVNLLSSEVSAAFEPEIRRIRENIASGRDDDIWTWPGAGTA